MAKRGVEWIDSQCKRSMDVAVALSFLPVALPVGAVALGASRLIDGEGAVFRQIRAGRDGEFMIRKIRTMRGAAEQHFANDNDRITPFGSLLRPTGIDEFPQIINILDGSMSVVGPRVSRNGTVENMRDALPRNLYDEWEEAYLSSKPGILSSYALARRLDRIVVHSPEIRAPLDIQDFKNASARYDTAMMLRAGYAGMRVLLRALRDSGPTEIAAEQQTKEFFESA